MKKSTLITSTVATVLAFTFAASLIFNNSETQVPPPTKKIVFGWVTFEDTKWPAPYSGGNIPADSLPWSVLTHVGMFATSGVVPAPARYVNQYPYFTAYAHSKGVYAGITIGGSGDGAISSVIADPTQWNNWINTYVGYIDQYKMDFLEFDLEGSYNSTNVGNFFSVLYDTLQKRQSGLNPSKPPFIVLTVGVSRAMSWNSATIQSKVEFVNLMTYDYNNNAWGRVTFDNSPMSYKNYDGTGGATDSCCVSGVNAIAPSMQRAIVRVAGAGWPKSKLTVGIDFNGGSWPGASYIRQPTAGLQDGGGSGPTFAGNWATWKTLPSDSIFFDQIAKAYWARVGTTLWTWISLPGKDSGIAATRKVVDAMDIGGVCIWNLGNEVWNTPSTSIPPGGRGWFYDQIEANFNYGSTPPPPTDSDGDGVIDANDLCPGTPIGTQVDINGCPIVFPPLDSDKDGVTDDKDLCPNTPIGTTVDATGCPIVVPPSDSDGDGVSDANDLCPNTPIGTTVDATGCPIVTPQYTLDMTLTGDYANGGSYTITAVPNTGTMDVKVLFYNNGSLYRTENAAPYCLFGDANNIATLGKLGVGPHTVIGLLYAQNGTTVLAKDTVIFQEGTVPPPPTDSDGDGVVDSKDLCPGTPTGTQVDANGCPVVVPPPSSGNTLYENNTLTSPWIYSGWSCTRTYNNASPAVSGTSLKAVLGSWGSMGFHSGKWSVETKLYTDSYSELVFDIYPTTNMKINVYVGRSGWNSTKKQIDIVAGKWTTIRLPMSTFVTSNQMFFDVQIQNFTGSSKTYYLDNVRLISKTATFKSSFVAPKEEANEETINDVTSFSTRVINSPTNPIVSLQVSVPEPGNVKFEMYDILGRIVENQAYDVSVGIHTYNFGRSLSLATGTYFIRTTLITASDKYIKNDKVLLVK